MKDADDYDKLWRSGAFEVDNKQKKTPTQPSSPPNSTFNQPPNPNINRTPNPNTRTAPTPQPGLSKSGELRRNLLIAGGVIGVGILAGVINQENIKKNIQLTPTPTLRPNPTTAPSPVAASPKPIEATQIIEKPSINQATPNALQQTSVSILPPPPHISGRLEASPSSHDVRSPIPEPTSNATESRGANLIFAEIEKIAKGILGPDFLGREAIRVFEEKIKRGGRDIQFFMDDIVRFPYSRRDLELAKENNEMLVLRPLLIWEHTPKGTVSTILGKDSPFTLTNFWRIFPQDGEPTMLYIAHSDDWGNTPLSTGDGEINSGWALVKKAPLRNSTSKTLNQQEEVIKQYGEFIRQNGGSQINARRRTATETVWDITLDKFVNNRNQMTEIRDWTSTKIGDGRNIYVRRFQNNLNMLEMHATSLGAPDLGVYPAR